MTVQKLCGRCRQPGHYSKRCPGVPAPPPAPDPITAPPPDRTAVLAELVELERKYRAARTRLDADQKEMLAYRHRIEDILDTLRKEMTS